MNKRTLLILVDYFGHSDTIECLESLRRMNGAFDIVVIDNAPQSDLGKTLANWKTNRDWVPPNNEIWRRLDRKVAVSDGEYSELTEAQALSSVKDRKFITLIRASANGGFAAGNNIGLRFGLTLGYDYFWLLNNDTVVETEALTSLLAKVQSEPSIGMCGTSVAFYGQPDKLQCRGGAAFNFSKATSTYLGFMEAADEKVDEAVIESRLTMVVGASLFVTRQFLENVGLMNEEYFLYFEEIDWAMRNAGRFRIGYSCASKIYHKHGSSTKSNIFQRKLSKNALKYFHPNRLYFTKKYAPENMFNVRFSLFLDAIKMAAKRDIVGAVAILHLSISSIKQRIAVIPLP